MNIIIIIFIIKASIIKSLINYNIIKKEIMKTRLNIILI
jgi:hypothetical protein